MYMGKQQSTIIEIENKSLSNLVICQEGNEKDFLRKG